MALNPCVSRETKDHIYDRMMMAAEDVHAYIRDTQDEIRALHNRRTVHHHGFDSLRIPVASSDDARADTTPTAAQPSNT